MRTILLSRFHIFCTEAHIPSRDARDGTCWLTLSGGSLIHRQQGALVLTLLSNWSDEVQLVGNIYANHQGTSLKEQTILTVCFLDLAGRPF